MRPRSLRCKRESFEFPSQVLDSLSSGQFLQNTELFIDVKAMRFVDTPTAHKIADTILRHQRLQKLRIKVDFEGFHTLHLFLTVIAKAQVRSLELDARVVETGNPFSGRPSLDRFLPLLQAESLSDLYLHVDDTASSRAFMTELSTSRLRRLVVNSGGSRLQREVNAALDRSKHFVFD
eukprot:gnl/Chilomastix_cuspidata/5576.p1 GENE.gnl/Chilomastix_cuspidata/5576~~gnl/Chilomastix_cuspidata/5576.p1  ORF type:complete len:186 (+),score=17.60 gnl/Chilomastix_cuspidata/5576:27-560(+)